jgi:hypothetical protein
LIDADNLSHAEKYNMPNQITGFKNRYAELSETHKILKKDFDGKEIMKEFGIKPGFAIGEIKTILGEYDEGYEFSKFKEEFGEKKLWVWKTYDTIFVSIFPRDELKAQSKALPVKDKLYIKYLEEELKLGKEEVWAKEYPLLYRRTRRRYMARDILTSVSNLLWKLSEMDGFKSISLEMDYYGDMRGEINWENGKDIII